MSVLFRDLTFFEIAKVFLKNPTYSLPKGQSREIRSNRNRRKPGTPSMQEILKNRKGEITKTGG